MFDARKASGKGCSWQLGLMESAGRVDNPEITVLGSFN
jgi:hypothetical protein